MKRMLAIMAVLALCVPAVAAAREDRPDRQEQQQNAQQNGDNQENQGARRGEPQKRGGPPQGRRGENNNNRDGNNGNRRFDNNNNDRRDAERRGAERRDNDRRFDNNRRFDNDRGRVVGRNFGYQRDPRAGRDFRFRGRSFVSVHAPRFTYPRGYGYRRWAIGATLPFLFLSAPYYVDWDYIGLPPPGAGEEWVRYGPDALLVDVYSGEVIDVAYGAFY